MSVIEGVNMKTSGSGKIAILLCSTIVLILFQDNVRTNKITQSVWKCPSHQEKTFENVCDENLEEFLWTEK